MATKKYLDYTGLSQVWTKIKEQFAPLSGSTYYAEKRLASGTTSGMVYTTSTESAHLTTSNNYYPTPIVDGIVYYKDSKTTKTGHYTPEVSASDTTSGSSQFLPEEHTSGSLNVIKGLTITLDSKKHVVGFHTYSETLNTASACTVSGLGGYDGLLSKEDKRKLNTLSDGTNYAPNRLASGATSGVVYTTSEVYSGLTEGRNYYPAPIVDGKVYYKDSQTTLGGHYTPETAGYWSWADDKILYADTPRSATSEMHHNELTSGVTVVDYVTLMEDIKGHVVAFSGTTKHIGFASYGLNAEGNSSYSGTPGLMMWQDKLKIDNIESGSQVNVIESVTVGSTTFGPTGITNKAIDITNAVNGLINTKVSSAVVPKGTKTFAQLTATTISVDTLGDMYNISDEFTINNQFKEYDASNPKSYPAGTNVVCVEDTSGVYKWDVMAGFVDLSAYLLSDDVSALTETEINTICV